MITTLRTGPAAIGADTTVRGCGRAWRASATIEETGSANARHPIVAGSAALLLKAAAAATCGNTGRSTGAAAGIRVHAWPAGLAANAAEQISIERTGSSGSGCRARRPSMAARATTTRSTGALEGIGLHASSSAPLVALEHVDRPRPAVPDPAATYRRNRRSPAALRARLQPPPAASHWPVVADPRPALSTQETWWRTRFRILSISSVSGRLAWAYWDKADCGPGKASDGAGKPPDFVRSGTTLRHSR